LAVNVNGDEKQSGAEEFWAERGRYALVGQRTDGAWVTDTTPIEEFGARSRRWNGK
jgi:hypothetical protein